MGFFSRQSQADKWADRLVSIACATTDREVSSFFTAVPAPPELAKVRLAISMFLICAAERTLCHELFQLRLPTAGVERHINHAVERRAGAATGSSRELLDLVRKAFVPGFDQYFAAPHEGLADAWSLIAVGFAEWIEIDGLVVDIQRLAIGLATRAAEAHSIASAAARSKPPAFS